MQETEKRRREEETRMWALILQHLLVTWPWTSFPISLILTKCKLILDPLLTPSPVTNLEKSNWKRKAAKSVLISNKFTLPVNTGNSSFDGGVCVCVCVCVCVAQSCLTLCGQVDCCLPGSSVNGILQTRMMHFYGTLPEISSSSTTLSCSFILFQCFLHFIQCLSYYLPSSGAERCMSKCKFLSVRVLIKWSNLSLFAHRLWFRCESPHSKPHFIFSFKIFFLKQILTTFPTLVIIKYEKWILPQSWPTIATNCCIHINSTVVESSLQSQRGSDRSLAIPPSL